LLQSIEAFRPAESSDALKQGLRDWSVVARGFLAAESRRLLATSLIGAREGVLCSFHGDVLSKESRQTFEWDVSCKGETDSASFRDWVEDQSYFHDIWQPTGLMTDRVKGLWLLETASAPAVFWRTGNLGRGSRERIR
jgi:hypothetical protein